MNGREYEAARILISMKYSGVIDSVQPPLGPCVSLQAPVNIPSPWLASSVPYFSWHGKCRRFGM
jgi:hypothetical protein